MSNGALSLKNNDEYYTPLWFVRMIMGQPDYDPATTAQKAVEFGLSNFDTKTTDGLKRD